MSLFSRFSKGTHPDVAVLIDISSDSVGGAFVALAKDTPPTLYYSVRLPIPPSRELSQKKMCATLADVLEDLVTKGAPATREAIGNSTLKDVLVSVAPPWQETKVRSEHIEEKDNKEFTFTHGVMKEAMHRPTEKAENMVLTEEVVAAIMLNGYETPEPFGKRAKHADLVVLSSYIESETEAVIRKAVSGAFHTHEVRLTSLVSVTNTVLRDVFPHEHDFLMLDISGEVVDVVLIKQNIPRDLTSLPIRLSSLHEAKRVTGITSSDAHDHLLDLSAGSPLPKRIQNTKDRWLAGITDALHDIHKRSPLPHTVFLVADTAYRSFAKDLLDTPSLRAVWLSDDPLTILSVEPSHLEPFIQVRAEAKSDLFLSMLALYAYKLVNSGR